jgi:hypothetical protein
MNLGENRIGKRILRLARSPAVPRFPHSQAIPDRVHNSLLDTRPRLNPLPVAKALRINPRGPGGYSLGIHWVDISSGRAGVPHPVSSWAVPRDAGP